MADLATVAKTDGANDADLLAIRNLIETDTPAAPVIDAPRCEPCEAVHPQEHVAAPARKKVLPTQTVPAPQPASPAQGQINQNSKALMRTVVARLKAYRPERRSILWTSLVLMLLLQPFFVWGWSMFICCVVAITYFVMGGDVFWRRIISLFQAFQARKPTTAREIKLRAYKIGKKWDRFLRWMPDGLADQMRGPDIRSIIAADAQHEAALSHRLDQLRDDPAAG